MANPFNVDNMMKHIEAENIEVQKETTFKVLRHVVMNSAVDEGFYKGSHVVSFKNTSDEVPDTADKSGGATIAKGQAVITKIDTFGFSSFVQTNLPYSKALEFGHSQQMPTGNYRLAAQAVGQ